MIQDKIKTRDELVKITGALRKAGKTVGFTSGAFDLLHAGHADYLEKARALCDCLVVGVNTDESVRRYKGENRPLITQDWRVKVLAALASVDYVFLFGERRNRENIERLKPDYYIKAGDYKPEALTSREIVEKEGGEIRLIPVAEPVSTTAIIEKIVKIEGRGGGWVQEEGAVHQNLRPPKMSPALFVDRDGTINREVSYLHEPEKFELLPGALEGMKAFQEMGYRIVVITNQPGIGMGYFSKEDFYRVNREMLRQLSAAGILVDKIFFCPHSKSEGCDCRKPGQALVLRARDELNLDLSASVFVGDKSSDMETGRRAGMKTILVKTGFSGLDGEFAGSPDAWAETLLEASLRVLEWERG